MAQGRVVVYGGKGALGQAVIEHFKQSGYWILSIDLHSNEAADANVIVNAEESWTEQEKNILNGVASSLATSKVDGVFCVAGGWAGGSAEAPEFVKNADLMWKQSVWSSSIAARIAALHLKPGGVLQLTGAAPALEGTPGMIGYGMAKAAVHQLTASLASKGSGLPEGSTALCILPVTLDTPMNRKWMPKADFGTWTPLTWVASQFETWLHKPADRPQSGSLLKLTTKGGETEITKF
ncbi:hypothetical protein WR25_01813 [Diploscapter pachys]|uniref:Dihydropteridine reductase n=1 Tax=Diploscapter pachys TaxID=2018661 RepID=A0A2A2L4N7_9BILA|nr:hypothetical protein WR25_01813 [Diploscapter pachys]